MEGAADLIKEILDREDIEGLLSVGAPPDEYAPEAQMLAQRLHGAERSGQDLQAWVAKEVQDVWQAAFGPFSRDDLAMREAAFDKVAAGIIQAFPQML
ncbi:MAG: hypothetical protein KGM47_06955 [Acidobacteriota bacterium]|nr:hypothetical protein [Acidobacteriota bacterium]